MMNHPPHAWPQVVLSDVDDTLTWEGQLPVAALAALHNLAARGCEIVLVTGACAGWCDQMARTWPVSAVIGENGAFTIERQGRHLIYHDSHDAATRARHHEALHRLAAEVIARFPQLQLAQDQAYRRYDLALDHGQEVAGVPAATIAGALAMLQAGGARAAVSSIHINAWLGEFSKLASAQRWLAQRHGWQAAQMQQHCAYVGDSPNDAAMFGFFPHSVGVANIAAHLPNLAQRPAHITRAPGGLGFAEWVDELMTTG
ncbi:HAD family hydrolase [Chitinimonas sp.]|uniref:HAD family hydrolase n=1 Tax=Chitinimonas sp. TaxID=1934313 RepID=UPI0035B2A8E8